MAVEPRRGCGFRKVGGLYLVGSGAGVACDRLPIPLTVCPCCSAGFKQARGWTWIDLNLLVQGVHRNCADTFPCPLCMATAEMGKVGLLWIGARFYSTPGEFMREASTQGISRRISAVPRGFRAGETWVLLAHPRGATCAACGGGGLQAAALGNPFALERPALECPDCDGTGKIAGVFRVFRPSAVEKIITESQSRGDPELMAELAAKNIRPVIVPDDDPDHRGTVYDDDEPAGGAK